ncbi:MAG TPA: glycerophosphodiester phosphodiesterase family protein [Nitrospiria bacterium]|nr:glycerophosphodiester phosphodiesterase family protein [Nitrospiria bacterium]
MRRQDAASAALPMIIAHRGASGYAPENTLPAFRKAVELGCQMIELDVRLSADEMPVVIHDGTLTRTAGDPRRVNQLTIDQLRQLDAGRWFAPEYTGERIPTLAEALAAIPDTVTVNIEVKPSGPGELHRMIDRIAAVITELRAEKRLLCSSFTHKALWALRRRFFSLPLGYLIEGRVAQEQFTEAKGLQASALILQGQWTTPAVLRQAHANRLKVYCYTINRPLQMRQLLRKGVDGIMTNYPDRLVRVIGQVEEETADRPVRRVRV